MSKLGMIVFPGLLTIHHELTGAMKQSRYQCKALNLTSCFVSLFIASFCLTGFSQSTLQPTLIEATKNQNIVAISRLLQQQFDVDTPQGDGATALHWSVYRNNLEITELLLANDANPNSADDNGVSPLSLASLNSNPRLVSMLIDAGADVNSARSSGETPLMIASHVGNTEIIQRLLDSGAIVNARENIKSHTALMFAVAENHLDAVQLLIENGASTTARSSNNFTPLLFAAQKGNTEIGRLLLANAADANESAPDGISGNTNARWNLVPDTAASVLLVAIDSDHEEMALMLLRQGADPDLDGAGRTALHSAVQHQMPTLVQALLDSGANPNARLTRSLPVFSRVILIDNGMSVDKLGSTPFLLAAGFGDLQIMDILIDNGADPLLMSDDGTTALMLAAGADFVEGQDKYNRRWFEDNLLALQDSALLSVQKCLQLGIDINARNQRQQTALHGAVYLAGTELLSYLIDSGADIDAINNRGQTPWMIASKGEYRAGSLMTLPHIADHLQNLGADISLGEDLGRYYERDARQAQQ